MAGGPPRVRAVLGSRAGGGLHRPAGTRVPHEARDAVLPSVPARPNEPVLDVSHHGIPAPALPRGDEAAVVAGGPAAFRPDAAPPRRRAQTAARGSAPVPAER